MTFKNVVILPVKEFIYEHKTDWKSIYIGNVVGFLSAIHMGTLIATTWPYLKILNPSINEQTFGIIRGASSFANILASAFAGYVSNRTNDTKPSMIAAKVLAIISAVIYLLIEVITSVELGLFIASEIIHGISMGLMSVFRTYVAMNSTETDRSKAFGITMFAMSFGMICGPLLSMFLTLFPYPGSYLFLGIHWNLYTAPIILSFLLSFSAIALLALFFNGKLHNYTHLASNTSLSSSESSDSNLNLPNLSYDKLAVAVMLLIKISSEVNFLGITSISTMYAMTAFSWTSKQSVTYQSAIMVLTGGCSLLFSGVYIFFKLDRKIPERICLFIACVIFLGFYLVTYPWFFIQNTIPYEHIGDGVFYHNQSEAKNFKQLLGLNGTTVELVGCSVNYAWCETTPQINVYVYMIAQIITLGIAAPLIQINLDILYSKILGPIKQGLHQAGFFGTGQALNVVGPVIFTSIYAASGPKWIWTFEIIFTVICLVILSIFYKRLIPFTVKLEKENQKPSSNRLVTDYENIEMVMA